MKISTGAVQKLVELYRKLQLTSESEQDGRKLILVGDGETNFILERKGRKVSFLGGRFTFAGGEVSVLEDYSLAMEDESGELAYLDNETLANIYGQHLENVRAYYEALTTTD